ncbi:MAG: hypothetical protein KGJ55_08690 [Gammaproteobacteria bacterium]|nr:hypothetical protein [Gammaproteobacteria bacterium]
MNIAASAPGKLLLLGEYAVLEGAPALVLAVEVRARAHLSVTGTGDSWIEAPEVLSQRLHFTRDPEGSPRWPDADSRTRLALVDQVLRGLAMRAQVPAGGLALELDTAAFFVGGSGVRRKLGLGSSAALTVALASALAAAAGAPLADRDAWLAQLLTLHRAFQGGRGSGADLAAAVHGGCLVYRLTTGDRPQVAACAWPVNLPHLFVWSGRPASTGDFLARLAAWREQQPRRYAAHFAELETLAEAGAEAVARGQNDALLAACAEYAVALQKLGDAAKIAIYSAAHCRIGALVAAAGGVYKPCGAGGGDLGVALCADPERIVTIRRKLAQAGFACPQLTPARQGLELQVFGAS